MSKVSWMCGSLLSCGAAALLLTAAPGTAQANDEERMVLGVEVSLFASQANLEVWTPYHFEKHPSATACSDKVALRKKNGLKDSDVIVSPSFKAHANAKEGKRGDYEITVADAAWFCERFATAHRYQRLRLDVQLGFDLAAWMKMVKPEEAGGMSKLDLKPKACLAALDGLVKLGKTGSDVIKLTDGETTIDGARTVCTQALEDAKAFKTAVAGREQAEQAAISGAYTAVGIKGARLELFVSYGAPDDSGWLAAGCTKWIDTAKAMKKAKKMFRWLTDNDGVITVRKYTFKGDKYKTSEKRYLTEAKAYKGCK